MLATVVELWRYPVKSLLGEVLDEVTLEQRGVVGDRLYAVTDRNGKLGSGKTNERFRRLDGLFELRARVADEQTLVTLPDGRELAAGDPVLDAFLSDRYQDELRVAREGAVSHHDASPLHLLTTASVEWLRRNSLRRRSTGADFARTCSWTARAKGWSRTPGWAGDSLSATPSSASSTEPSAV